MKIGLGLYRHMLTREYYDFARQAGCTHVVIHLVDYFRQGASNPTNNQPTGAKYEPWGVAGDPEKLWTVDEIENIRKGIEDAGLTTFYWMGRSARSKLKKLKRSFAASARRACRCWVTTSALAAYAGA
jgi:hypothetical protein